MSEINDIKEIPEGTFPINLKFIKKYQRAEPSMKDKYKDDIHQQGSFRWGSNIDIKLITCRDKIFIPSKIQSYVEHWYHTYLLHPGMDRTEAMIRQYLFCPYIRDSVHKEGSKSDTYQRTKKSNIKYGKLTAK